MMPQFPEPLNRLTSQDIEDIRRVFRLAAHAKAYAAILNLPQTSLIEIMSVDAMLRQLSAIPLR
jgi:hypothetical protein